MTRKILIADDEENIRALIRKTLEFAGGDFEIYEANDGVEAIRMAKKIRPNMIILDVMMPGMTGYEVCKAVKKSEETQDVYILFLTARGGSISKTTVDLCGGNDFVTKPFDPDELGLKIKKALGMS